MLNAIANGYTVDEPLYRVPLKGLATTSGNKQYLTFGKNGNWFACTGNDNLKQEFNENELKRAPEWVQQLRTDEVEND